MHGHEGLVADAASRAYQIAEQDAADAVAYLAAPHKAPHRYQAKHGGQLEERVVLHNMTCYDRSCATQGWETRLADGTTTTTECVSSECLHQGWTTTFSANGAVVQCRCRGGDCVSEGAECAAQ
jgi:hypothetical protein